MTKTPLMRLIEIEFGAPLERLFSEWAAEGLNARLMAERCRGRGIPVTPNAIRLWTRTLGGRPALVFPENAASTP